VTVAEEISALEQSLRRRFRVAASDVTLADHALTILHPASAEDLINEADFERDERLPYWAELWPSAMVLGAEVLGAGGGGTMLELGCGAGLVTTCAALAGFAVTASDYYEDATRFARVNAWRNGGRKVRGLMLDWRELPDDLPTFDAVIASDVLYERPYGPLVAAVVGRVLAPGGFALVADPGRVGREGFLAALAGHRLEVAGQRSVPYVNGDIRQTIGLFEIRRGA
jgi:SAM-dependent methyltransferase